MTHAVATAPLPAATESTVFIASENVLAKWSSSAAPADLLTIADADAEQALAVIERRRPHCVVLSQVFAVSERGATLVNDLRSNSALAGLDIRILSDERSAALGASEPITGRLIASVAQSLELFTSGSTRRARRMPVPPGSEIHVDGKRAALINVSALGVQIVSTLVLRPNSKVKVVILREGIEVCTRAEIAWSSLELASNAVTYRAGIAFAQAQPEFVKLKSPTAR